LADCIISLKSKGASKQLFHSLDQAKGAGTCYSLSFIDMYEMEAREVIHNLAAYLAHHNGAANNARPRQYRHHPRRKRELTNQWIHMKILHMIWQRRGPTCANLKTTLQIKIMFHKDTVHPARERLGRTDVCLRHNG
jgi:hypothetical protein